MKRFIYLFFLLAILLTCGGQNQPESDELTVNEVVTQNNELNNDTSYRLVEMDHYAFRRAYHDSENMTGAALDAFMNRNPEPNEDYSESSEHPYYKQLIANELFVDGNLNLGYFDTLPEKLIYHYSKNESFTIETRLLEDPKLVPSPSYELTFLSETKTVLIDTLAFDFRPDVTFFTCSLDSPEKEVLVTVFQCYIVNGDNFDIRIYELQRGSLQPKTDPPFFFPVLTPLINKP